MRLKKIDPSKLPLAQAKEFSSLLTRTKWTQFKVLIPTTTSGNNLEISGWYQRQPEGRWEPVGGPAALVIMQPGPQIFLLIPGATVPLSFQNGGLTPTVLPWTGRCPFYTGEYDLKKKLDRLAALLVEWL